jgi:hypothetical protein
MNLFSSACTNKANYVVVKLLEWRNLGMENERANQSINLAVISNLLINPKSIISRNCMKLAQYDQFDKEKPDQRPKASKFCSRPTTNWKQLTTIHIFFDWGYRSNRVEKEIFKMWWQRYRLLQ